MSTVQYRVVVLYCTASTKHDSCTILYADKNPVHTHEHMYHILNGLPESIRKLPVQSHLISLSDTQILPLLWKRLASAVDSFLNIIYCTKIAYFMKIGYFSKIAYFSKKGYFLKIAYFSKIFSFYKLFSRNTLFLRNGLFSRNSLCSSSTWTTTIPTYQSLLFLKHSLFSRNSLFFRNSQFSSFKNILFLE